MAKGKDLNPADAYRKAQRRKELKKACFLGYYLEDEIQRLEESGEPSASDKSRLTNLKNELTRIVQKKDEYVKQHPEQRKLVYRPRKQDKGEDQKEAPPVEQRRNLFNKHGLPRHPERSIYYDPVMNPYGVPPPGMPYVEIERPLAEDEVDRGEDVTDWDDDIVMPEGPPPGVRSEDSETGSDDDIPMPEGPPPGNIPDSDNQAQSSLVPPSSLTFPQPLLLPSFNGSIYANPPPPLAPAGFFPRRIQSTAAIQDPLSSIPHQTYQAHRANQLPPGHPSLPPKPSGAPCTIPTGGLYTGAIISAEPELRDLKREATAFVPASLKRKKASGLPSSSKVNAAPCVNVGSEAVPSQARPDLVGVLKGQLGTITASPSNDQVPDKGPKAPIMKQRDDYQKFVDEMSDLLELPGSS